MRERLRAVFGAPAPIGIDRPQRDMCKHHNWRAAGARLEVGFQPLELIGAQFSEVFQSNHIHQPDKVHALLIEAVPTVALRALAVAFQILLAVIHRRVMLAGHIENLTGLGGLQQLVHGVEFPGLGRVAEVASMNDELRRPRQGVDLIHGGLQRAGYVRICGLLNPMWLSLICTKVISPLDSPAWAGFPNAREVRTPLPRVHTMPVPAQAMHSRNPLRLIPSSLWS